MMQDKTFGQTVTHAPPPSFLENINKNVPVSKNPFRPYIYPFFSVLSSDYDLSFQVRAAKSYSKIKKPIPDITAMTIAFWMRTSDTKPGTVISYATNISYIVQDNAFALQDYVSFVLFVNNRTVFTGLRANDGQWQNICGSSKYVT